METVADATESAAQERIATDPVEQAGEAIQAGLRVVQSALVLLRAELRLARSSAVSLIWLSFALIFFGVGAWLAISATLAVGIYAMTGSMLAGVAAVGVANILGAVAVLWVMRRCWRDLSLPRTRRLLSQGQSDQAP
ncbi:MAG: hypothetical protein WBV61_00285 [Rhodanobacteraceae bacterium]